jgi:hypothetical protein
MECSITTSHANVEASFHPDISGFVMTPTEVKPTGDDTLMLLKLLNFTLAAFLEGQTYFAGNLPAELVNGIATLYYHADGDLQNENIPVLFASLLKGMFEYQASSTLKRIFMSS